MGENMRARTIASGMWSFLREVGVVVVGGGLLYLLVSISPTHLRPTAHWPRREATNEISVGSFVTIKGQADKDKVSKLVIVTNEQCPYCRASSDFHRKLVSILGEKGRAYVAVPDLKKQKEYLNALKVPSQRARKWDDLSFRVSATPTVVLIGPDSKVKSIWIGRLDATGEEQVLQAIEDGSSARRLVPPRTAEQLDRLNTGAPIRETEIATLRAAGSALIVDVREMGRFQPSELARVVNIPLRELAIRAPIEARAERVIVDCSNITTASCNDSARILAAGGAVKVFSVGRSRYYESCGMGRSLVE